MIEQNGGFCKRACDRVVDSDSLSKFVTEAGMERSAMTDSTERFRHCALLHSGFCREKLELVDRLRIHCIDTMRFNVRKWYNTSLSKPHF